MHRSEIKPEITILISNDHISEKNDKIIIFPNSSPKISIRPQYSSTHSSEINKGIEVWLSSLNFSSKVVFKQRTPKTIIFVPNYPSISQLEFNFVSRVYPKLILKLWSGSHLWTCRQEKRRHRSLQKPAKKLIFFKISTKFLYLGSISIQI